MTRGSLLYVTVRDESLLSSSDIFVEPEEVPTKVGWY